MNTELKQILTEIEASCKRFNDFLAEREELAERRFNKANECPHKIDERLDKSEATIATKENLIAMESRILDAFRQFTTTVNFQDER